MRERNRSERHWAFVHDTGKCSCLTVPGFLENLCPKSFLAVPIKEGGFHKGLALLSSRGCLVLNPFPTIRVRLVEIGERCKWTELGPDPARAKARDHAERRFYSG